MQPDQILKLFILLTFALSSNIPLGYMRMTSRKYSFKWFILVHFSIPFIVMLRGHFCFSWRWIPLTLGCAVAGQAIGGWTRKRRLP